MSQETLWLKGADLVTPGGVIAKGVIGVSHGRISSVGTVGEYYRTPSEQTLDLKDCRVLPGFVDLHVHGGGGGDFGDVSTDGIHSAVETHWRYGTTSLMASIISMPLEELANVLGVLSSECAAPWHHGTLMGINLEGPFLGATQPGVHDRSCFVPPTKKLFKQLFRASRGTIKMVTFAPEQLRSTAVIAECVRCGVVAAMGHTGATYEQTQVATAAGVSHTTHCFNAMGRFHHRHPGVIGAALLSSGVTIELILDDRHLAPQTFELALRLKGEEGIIAVTDAMLLTGTTLRSGSVAGTEVTLTEDGVRDRRGSLAGTNLTMIEAFKRLHLEYKQPLPAAVRMTSTNAADLIGASDIGRLEPGCRANLVVVDKNLDVQLVFVGGECVVGTLADWRRPLDAEPIYAKEYLHTSLGLAQLADAGSSKQQKRRETRTHLEARIALDMETFLENEADFDSGDISIERKSKIVRRLRDEMMVVSRLYDCSEHGQDFTNYFARRMMRLLNLERYYAGAVADFTPFWTKVSSEKVFYERVFDDVIVPAWREVAGTPFRPDGFRSGERDTDKNRSILMAFDRVEPRIADRLWRHYMGGEKQSRPTEQDLAAYFGEWMACASLKLHSSVERAKLDWVGRRIGDYCTAEPELSAVVFGLLREGADTAAMARKMHASQRHTERVVLDVRRAAAILHQQAAAYDMHSHTQASDGTDSAQWLLDWFWALMDVKNLDGLLVVDHNAISGVLEKAWRQGILRGRLFLGEEIAMHDQTEMGCVFFTDTVSAADSMEMTVRPQRGLRDTAAEVHKRGGIPLITHPIGRNFSFLEKRSENKEAWLGSMREQGSPVVVEITNAKNDPAHNRAAWDRFEGDGWLCTGGSDGHWLELDLGQGFTLCERLDGTRADFVKKIGQSIVLQPIERGEEWRKLRDKVVREYVRHPRGPGER